MINLPNPGAPPREIAELLTIWAEEYGVALDNNAKLRILQYLEHLYLQNKKVNLVGKAGKIEILRKHFIDSLTTLPFIPEKPGLRMADIGAGAGFPGIALKIARPQISLRLIEATGKKCEFMREIISLLSLDNTEVLRGRAEHYGKDFTCREKFDVVVCRAVAHLSTISEYALPFLEMNGTFIAYKGPRAEQEIEESRDGIGVLGGRVAGMRQTALPVKREKRKVVFIEKVGRTPSEYPRGEGIPEKRPMIIVPRGTIFTKHAEESRRQGI